MSVLFLEKLGVCCLEETSEEEFCEQIARVCKLLQPAAEKCTEEERRQEFDLLSKHMDKK
jgi:uncharacterized cysteine cluster protein YcgN (CxxCxxCC family)